MVYPIREEISDIRILSIGRNLVSTWNFERVPTAQYVLKKRVEIHHQFVISRTGPSRKPVPYVNSMVPPFLHLYYGQFGVFEVVVLSLFLNGTVFLRILQQFTAPMYPGDPKALWTHSISLSSAAPGLRFRELGTYIPQKICRTGICTARSSFRSYGHYLSSD